jgi:hypothetical protein
MDMQVHTEITPGDMVAALGFMDKRIKRHGDIMEGMSASLFSVMLTVGECLHDSGLPLLEVERMFDQFKAQVAFKLAEKSAQPHSPRTP